MKRKLIIAILGVGLFVSGISIGAFANSHLEEIKAYLNHSLDIKVDGKVEQLDDGNGNAILPITYNGSTYLPIRAVSNLLNVAINYDHEAYEVNLGERLDGIAIRHEHFNDTLYSKDPAQRTFGGTDYEEVLFSAPGVAHNYTALRPEGKYQTLYLQIAAVDNDIEHIEIIDHDAKALLKRVENITTEAGMSTIEVDIAGVDNITINTRKESGGGWIIPLKHSYYK